MIKKAMLKLSWKPVLDKIGPVFAMVYEQNWQAKVRAEVKHIETCLIEQGVRDRNWRKDL